MKTFFLCLAMLAAGCIGLSAQNYQTVYSNRTALFSEGYSLQGMKMDSVKIEGNDSVFYPLKRIGATWGWGWECFSPYKASWLGDKIIISGHWNVFINDTDTVWIKTDAALDESWSCYSNQDYTIEAKVTAHELAHLLGIEDSVKTITFQAVDRENAVIEHLFDDKSLQISKNYGIVRGFDFTSLPDSPIECELAGISCPAIGIQNLTWKEVWNFEPGDVIHVLKRNHYWPNVQIEKKGIITYLEREEDENKIIYKLFIRENEYRRNYNSTDGSWTESTSYSDYETAEYVYSNAAFDKLPGEVIFNENYNASTNIISFFSDGSIAKAMRSYEIIYYRDFDGEECWRRPVTNDCMISIDDYYVKGLGGPYYLCDDFFNLSERTLVYYKKGETEWGTPLTLIKTGINAIKANTPQVVYDKISEVFLINYNLSPSSSCFFELIDLKGQLLIREKISSLPCSIPTGRFPNGFYLYRLMVAGEIIDSGKMMK